MASSRLPLIQLVDQTQTKNLLLNNLSIKIPEITLLLIFLKTLMKMILKKKSGKIQFYMMKTIHHTRESEKQNLPKLSRPQSSSGKGNRKLKALKRLKKSRRRKQKTRKILLKVSNPKT
jgi:hypothetical protein